MTATEMYRLLSYGVQDRNRRVFLPSEIELQGMYREREIPSKTFAEMNFQELFMAAFNSNHSWFSRTAVSRRSPTEKEDRLSPEDTKELDDFLNSFARKEAS